MPILSATMRADRLHSALYVHVARCRRFLTSTVVQRGARTPHSLGGHLRSGLRHLKTAVNEVLSFLNTWPNRAKRVSVSDFPGLTKFDGVSFVEFCHSTAAHRGRDLTRTNAGGRLTLGASWTSRPHQWACAVLARSDTQSRWGKIVYDTLFIQALCVGINNNKLSKLSNERLCVVLFFPVFPTLFCGFLSIWFDLQNVENRTEFPSIVNRHSFHRNSFIVLNLIFGTFAQELQRKPDVRYKRHTLYLRISAIDWRDVNFNVLWEKPW